MEVDSYIYSYILIVTIASYGAAQFGWQPHDEVFGSFGIGVGWIEREINAVRHIFENEIRSYDSELEELKAKLRQSMSYSTELRRRYEESVKTVYKYLIFLL